MLNIHAHRLVRKGKNHSSVAVRNIEFKGMVCEKRFSAFRNINRRKDPDAVKSLQGVGKQFLAHPAFCIGNLPPGQIYSVDLCKIQFQHIFVLQHSSEYILIILSKTLPDDGSHPKYFQRCPSIVISCSFSSEGRRNHQA